MATTVFFLCICAHANSVARAASATTIDAVRDAAVDVVANTDDSLEIVDPQKHEWRGGDAIVDSGGGGAHSSRQSQQQQQSDQQESSSSSNERASAPPSALKQEQENGWIVKTPQDAAVESDSLLAGKQQLVQDAATSSSSVLLFASLAVVVAFGLGGVLGYVIGMQCRRVMATRRVATVHSKAVSAANKKSSAEVGGRNQQQQRNTPTLGYVLGSYETDANRRNNGRADPRYNRQFDDREEDDGGINRLYNHPLPPAAMQHRETSAAMATLDAYPRSHRSSQSVAHGGAIAHHGGNEDFDDNDMLDLLVINPASSTTTTTVSRKQRLD